MALELFWGSGSPFSWRVLLALEAKRLSYESRLLQFSKGEHKAPEFLALNPRGQVPCLRDGDVVVSESIAILAYLDRKTPEPPLFGRTPAESGRIWQQVIECVLHLDEAVDGFILPIYRGQAAAHDAHLRSLLPRITRELARLEGLATRGDWLATAEPTAADLVPYPMVKSLLRALEKPDGAAYGSDVMPFATHFPALDRWMKRIEALPGYERTYPPHWR